MPRVEKVIIGEITRGEGTEEDPARRVIVVYDLDGGFIAEHDDWKHQHCETVFKKEK